MAFIPKQAVLCCCSLGDSVLTCTARTFLILENLKESQFALECWRKSGNARSLPATST